MTVRGRGEGRASITIHENFGLTRLHNILKVNGGQVLHWDVNPTAVSDMVLNPHHPRRVSSRTSN